MSIVHLAVAVVLSQVTFSWHARRYPELSVFTVDGIRNMRALCADPQIRKVEVRRPS